MKQTNSFKVSLCVGLAMMVSVCNGWCAPPGREITVNGGFEELGFELGLDGFRGWSRNYPGNMIFGGKFAFQGNYSASIAASSKVEPGGVIVSNTVSLWQDLPTVVGGEYLLRFAAAAPWVELSILSVYLNDQPVITRKFTPQIPFIDFNWQKFEYKFTADAVGTRLRFANEAFGPVILDEVHVFQIGGPITKLPPVIEVQPGSQTLYLGATLKLGVVAKSEMSLTYQWYFNGAALAGETSETLVISNVQMPHQGDYYVLVTNLDGGVQSSSAHLTVSDPLKLPPIISFPSADQYLSPNMGQTIVLRVDAKSPTTATYQWYLNEKPLTGETDSLLSVRNIQQSQGGDYYVRVTNPYGSAQSAITHVTVLAALRFPPSIAVPPKDQFVSRGGILQLTVIARLASAEAYQWYFNGQLLADQKGPTLTIVNVQSNHEGDYYAVVSNFDGAVQSPSAHVTVREPGLLPVIFIPPEILNAVLPMGVGRTYDPVLGGELPAVKIFPGYSIALRTIARSESPVTYFWFLGNDLVTTETTGVLNLQSLQPSTGSSEYRVVAQNASGAVEARLLYRLLVPLLAPDWKRGVINFGNSKASQVFDADGITPLGRGFAVQCYAGGSPDYLIAVGTPLNFSADSGAGLFGPASVEVPDIPPDAVVYVQAKAWEAAKGRSYEEAKDAGGKAGASEVVNVMAGTSGGDANSGRAEFKTFQLRSALPDQPSVKFSAGRVLEDGRPEWTLAGEPGTYLIERKSISFTWIPIALVTNRSFSVTFQDVIRPGEATFYRARRYE